MQKIINYRDIIISLLDGLKQHFVRLDTIHQLLFLGLGLLIVIVSFVLTRQLVWILGEKIIRPLQNKPFDPKQKNDLPVPAANIILLGIVIGMTTLVLLEQFDWYSVINIAYSQEVTLFIFFGAFLYGLLIGTILLDIYTILLSTCLLLIKGIKLLLL